MSQPPKVLLLYAHPESQDSIANRVLLQPAHHLEHVTVHDLYAHYPDFLLMFTASSNYCGNTTSSFSNILFTPTAAPRC